MTTKYNINDTVRTKKFTGVISMITITRKGIRYRGLGVYEVEPGNILIKHQHEFMEDEVLELVK